MQKIEINTKSRPSTVYCGTGAFEIAYEEILKDKDIFLLTDSNVARIYKDFINKYFSNANIFVMPAGEKNKNQKTLFSILDKMVEVGCNRKTTLVALGGGVVGDVGGFASSLYMRGTHIIQIPTTLLAQVDSSVGGKTAIDYKGYKNIIGSFYQPEKVICDPMFLKTLSKREIRCGLGEIIKTAILDAGIYQILKDRKRLTNLDFIEKLISMCVRFKASVVEKDEQEISGIRKCLNMGHTTAHTLELNYGKLSHGEFVLIGMYYESKIAMDKGICSKEYCQKIIEIIYRVIKEIPVYSDISNSAKSALLDKKNSGKNTVSIIVPKSVGEYSELILPIEEYSDYLTKINGGEL